MGSREGRVDMTASHYFIAWLHPILELEGVKRVLHSQGKVTRVK